MKLQCSASRGAIVAMKNGFHSAELLHRPQSCVPKVRPSSEEFVSKLLDRRWALPSPDTKIHQIMLSPPQVRSRGGPFGYTSLLNNTQPAFGDGMMAKDEKNPSFYIVRDDLLHPLVNGNKARKLDGLLPLIEDHSVTDVATVVMWYCSVTFLKLLLPVKLLKLQTLRKWMLIEVLKTVQERLSLSMKAQGRLWPYWYLSQNHLLGTERPLKFVVDAGTGTTAVGLGLGALCLGLPWEVTAVMLADTVDGYKEQEKRLISNFKRCFSFHDLVDHSLNEVHDDGIVNWVERCHPRKFGNVLKGEVEACQQIAQQTGILVDPMYTLAAWEMAALLSEEGKGAVNVVMLHTGGTLGMFGLAQRYKSYFHTLKDGLSI
ncbi:hypothetical protein FH972_009259 [Carpinus fangiana]|uniref:Tryptophan synthase beta chain-like PALP domain-containing protein n=1 Tax=Carpinus fangiana TaxID=176857 RepID=A0A5N6R4D2_9ROSI|nr:hypothetical protein FH972_009259 [Carpinus fangiana]